MKNNSSQIAFKLSSDTKALQWNQNRVPFKLWAGICLILFLLSCFRRGSSEWKTKSCWNFYLADEYTYYIPPPTHLCMHIYTQTHTGHRNSQMCCCEQCEPRAIKTRQNPCWLCVSNVLFPLFILPAFISYSCMTVCVPTVPGLSYQYAVCTSSLNMAKAFGSREASLIR